MAEASEGTVSWAHRVEPTLHDAEPLLFAGDAVQLATPEYGHTESLGSQDPEHLAEAALFEPGPECARGGRSPIETLAAPLSEDGHDLTEAADGSAPWGGQWGGFKDETAHAEDGAVGVAEPDQEAGLESVDFAAITGRAALGSGAGAVT